MAKKIEKPETLLIPSDFVLDFMDSAWQNSETETIFS